MTPLPPLPSTFFGQYRFSSSNTSLRTDMDAMQGSAEMLDSMKQQQLDHAARIGDVNTLLEILASNMQHATPLYVRILRTLQYRKLWETALRIVDYALETQILDKGNWMLTIDIMLESPLIRDTLVLLQLMAKHQYKPSDVHVKRLIALLKEADLLPETLVLIDALIASRFPPSQDVHYITYILCSLRITRIFDRYSKMF